MASKKNKNNSEKKNIQNTTNEENEKVSNLKTKQESNVKLKSNDNKENSIKSKNDDKKESGTKSKSNGNNKSSVKSKNDDKKESSTKSKNNDSKDNNVKSKNYDKKESSTKSKNNDNKESNVKSKNNDKNESDTKSKNTTKKEENELKQKKEVINNKEANQKDSKDKNAKPKFETKEEKLIFKNNNKKTEKRTKTNNENNKIAYETGKKKENEIAKVAVLEEKENMKKEVIIALVVMISVLVIILVFSTTFAMIHSTKNTIASGVKIKSIDVSGLTYDDAKSKLDKLFKNVLSVDIKLKYKDDYEYTIKPEDIDLSYDLKSGLDKAYSIGRSGNILKCNYSLIATGLFKTNIDFDYKYNEGYIDSIVDEVSTNIPGLVTQYSHYIEGNNLIITPGKNGIQVNKDKLKYFIINDITNRNPLTKVATNEIEIPYNQVKADEIDIDKIYEEIHTEPKDAYFEPATEDKKAKISADVDGIDFAISIDEAKEMVKQNLNEYIIPITRTKANVTINDIGLEAFPDKLQEFSTRYDASNTGRSENLRIATSKIDGTVLMPGQQFSFNGVVGERTVQEGYKNAAIYEGDSVVDGLAGGICQVSSTLYNVALLANLQIDERHNHSFKPTYVDAGRDATVVYGIKDFKFTNTRSYPIKIEGSAENGVITFSLHGITEEKEYKINIIPEITATIPYDVQKVQNNSLAPGTQRVTQLGTTGYKTTTYKETILNGAIISKEVISNDIYKSMARIIEVGPAVTIPTAETTPASTPELTVPAQ